MGTAGSSPAPSWRQQVKTGPSGRSSQVVLGGLGGNRSLTSEGALVSRDQEKGHRIPCPSLSIGNDSIKKSCLPPAALGVPFLSPVLTHWLAIQ